MKPPICAVCGLDGLLGERRGTGTGTDGFVTRQFANYVPLPDGMAGHPDGLLWLCAGCDRATTDLHGLVARDAIRAARERRGLRPGAG